MLAAVLALAASLPVLDPLPPPAAPHPDDCPEFVELHVGEQMPEDLVDRDGVVRCRMVVVPTGELVDLLQLAAYAEGVHAEVAAREDLIRLEINVLEVQLAEARAARRRAYWRGFGVGASLGLLGGMSVGIALPF